MHLCTPIPSVMLDFELNTYNTLEGLPPVSTSLRPVAGITFEMSSFIYKCNISQFKHLLYYLCSIMNKILAHVIW